MAGRRSRAAAARADSGAQGSAWLPKPIDPYLMNGVMVAP